MDIYQIDRPFNNGKMLEGMFEYQQNLMIRYEQRGLLPDPQDLHIDTKPGQAFIKSLIQNIIEELAEADQAQDRLVAMVSQPNLEGLDTDLYEKYSSEIADVLHFYIELMIYTKIYPEDVQSFYKVILEQENLPLAFSDGLTTSMKYGRHINIFNNPEIVSVKSVSRLMFSDAVYEQMYWGGRHQHPLLDLQTKRYNWEITKKLSLAANFLKNRAWVQGERPFPNLLEFQREVMYSWVALFALLDAVGFEEKGVYYQYEKKNLINQKRIIEKY